MTSRPIVSPGVKNNRLEFKCEFKSDDKEAHSVFEVTWYEGTPVRKFSTAQILKGDQRVATIRNTNKYPDDPIFYLGTTVSLSTIDPLREERNLARRRLSRLSLLWPKFAKVYSAKFS